MLNQSDIINYRHKFYIRGEEIELLINRKNGCWECKLLKGETGTGICSGGKYEDLYDYIKAQERQHTHSYYFYNYHS